MTVYTGARLRLTMCNTSSVLWSAMRSVANVNLDVIGDNTGVCIYRYDRADFKSDKVEYDEGHILASLGKAIREDPRLQGEPIFRWLYLDICLQYIHSIADDKKL